MVLGEIWIIILLLQSLFLNRLIQVQERVRHEKYTTKFVEGEDQVPLPQVGLNFDNTYHRI